MTYIKDLTQILTSHGRLSIFSLVFSVLPETPWCCSLWTYWHLLVASETLLQGKEFMYKGWASARDTLKSLRNDADSVWPRLVLLHRSLHIYLHVHWPRPLVWTHMLRRSVFFMPECISKSRQKTTNWVTCEMQATTKNLIFSRKGAFNKVYSWCLKFYFGFAFRRQFLLCCWYFVVISVYLKYILRPWKKMVWLFVLYLLSALPKAGFFLNFNCLSGKEKCSDFSTALLYICPANILSFLVKHSPVLNLLTMPNLVEFSAILVNEMLLLYWKWEGSKKCHFKKKIPLHI